MALFLDYVPLDDKQIARRRVYWLVAALFFSLLFCLLPLFEFIPDEGLQYARSFTSHPFRVVSLQTDLVTGIATSLETLHLYGLIVAELALFATCLIAMISRNPLTMESFIKVSKIISALFYVVVFAYIVIISDRFFATVRPTWTLIFPALMYFCCSRADRYIPD